MTQSETSNGNTPLITTDKELFINVTELSAMLGISKSKAYAIIRDLNKELSSKGFITIGGKVLRRYLCERMNIV